MIKEILKSKEFQQLYPILLDNLNEEEIKFYYNNYFK